MREVAIIGAGELGGATAHALARHDLARTVRIIDEHARVAEGKALDIAQAAPVEGFAAVVSGATDLSHAAGADVVVIADAFGAGEWQGEEALALVRRLSDMAPRAIVVCAGAVSASLVDRCVRELRMPRARLFGSAPEALAGGARALVALALDGSPRDVGLALLGLPPAHTVIPWQDATVGGLGLTRMLDEPARRRIEVMVAALWPPGPVALAAAAAKAIAAIEGRSRQLVSCFIAPDVTDAGRLRTAAFPARLGPAGVAEVVVPTLSVAERVALDNAMML
jgi:malate dehydrogenase